MLHFMGSQRVRRCLATEQQQQQLKWQKVNGLQPTRLLSPWDFPGKSTGVGCHCLLQGIFLIQGSNPGLPHCRQMLYPLSHQGSPGFNSWVGKIPWRRKWQLTPVFLPRKSRGQRRMVGYSPQSHKESDTAEGFHFHLKFTQYLRFNQKKEKNFNYNKHFCIF